MKTLVHVCRKLLELARELSDETAYARYLRQSGETHSALSWRTFSDQRLARKYKSAKCC